MIENRRRAQNLETSIAHDVKYDSGFAVNTCLAFQIVEDVLNITPSIGVLDETAVQKGRVAAILAFCCDPSIRADPSPADYVKRVTNFAVTI